MGPSCGHIIRASVLAGWMLSGVNSSGFIQWPGGPAGYPSNPPDRIHFWKEEAIVGNQYMTVQLDQNGSIYDIYYPSVGFRRGSGTANEGYHGPEEFIGGPFGCGSDPNRNEANGQMNVIAGMAGIGILGGGTNSIYWLKNSNGTDYVTIGQQYVTDNNVVYTTNKLNITGSNIKVEQYDFCPATNAIPPVATDGVRTNYGVYVKRVLLTNLEGSSQTFNFYFDMNWNVKGDDAFDNMYVDPYNSYRAMVVYDRDYRQASGGGCSPDGFGYNNNGINDYYSEYNFASLYPSFGPSPKDASIYFATAMKEVTNDVTGAGVPADTTWRDLGSTDNYEGWIGKSVTLGAGQTKEIDIVIVGSWDDGSGATGTHDYWGRPLLDWFFTNSMATAQSTTETYWSNWLAQGVAVDLPGTSYDTLFKRSLLVTALHVDAKSGSIIAGMHNGAYPFVWPRDGVYAAITLDRTGHTKEAENFYRWLRDVAFRYPDNNPG